MVKIVATLSGVSHFQEAVSETNIGDKVIMKQGEKGALEVFNTKTNKQVGYVPKTIKNSLKVYDDLPGEVSKINSWQGATGLACDFTIPLT